MSIFVKMRYSQVTFSYNYWPSHSLIKLFNRAYSTGKLKASDRAVLLNTLLDPTAQKKDLRLIDHLCWAIWQGQVAIADAADFPPLDVKFKSSKPSINKDGDHHYGGRLAPRP